MAKKCDDHPTGGEDLFSFDDEEGDFDYMFPNLNHDRELDEEMEGIISHYQDK